MHGSVQSFLWHRNARNTGALAEASYGDSRVNELEASKNHLKLLDEQPSDCLFRKMLSSKLFVGVRLVPGG